MNDRLSDSEECITMLNIDVKPQYALWFLCVLEKFIHTQKKSEFIYSTLIKKDCVSQKELVEAVLFYTEVTDNSNGT